GSRRVRFVETDRLQRQRGVPVPFAIVVNASPVLGVQSVTLCLTPWGSSRFHHPQQTMGPSDAFVRRALGLHLVLHEQADRLPGDLEVFLVGDATNPLRRGPAPRTDRIDPETTGGSHVFSLRRVDYNDRAGS